MTMIQTLIMCCVLFIVEYSNCTTGDVRLMNGPSPNKGRVEMCLNRVWVSICNNSFSSSEANTVCGQLGYQDQS